MSSKTPVFIPFRTWEYMSVTTNQRCHTGLFCAAMKLGLLALLGLSMMASAIPVHLLPRWEPTYNMSMSTIIQPCNFSGQMDAHFLAKWGIASIDWSNAHAVWANTKPMNSDELLLEQAKSIKSLNPDTKVWVYRNIVKALPWFTTVREKILDPAYSGWFLKFRDGAHGEGYTSPSCTKGQGCSEFYHDQLQTPTDKGSGLKPGRFAAWCNETCDCGHQQDGTLLPCGEYLFDHRNSSLGNWFVQEFFLGALGLGSKYVDGYFLDDVWSGHGSWGCSLTSPFGGPSECADNCTDDMGLNVSTFTDIQTAWHQNYVVAKAVSVAAGGFSWQLLNGISAPPIGPGATAQCTAFFEEACAPNSDIHDSASALFFTNSSTGRAPFWKTDLAAFLLVRGPFAWIGHAWYGCVDRNEPVGGPGEYYERPPALDEDYGEPEGLCLQTKPGVFSRKYSKANIEYDCNHGGSATLQKLP